MIITSCGNSEKIAKKIAQEVGAKYSQLIISSFPDGEMYLRYKDDLKAQKVVIIHSFQPNPNKSLFEIIFAAQTAKDLGAKKVILMAPYLAYMRQDKRFNPGEGISSRIMAKLLNGSLDKIITIDPHLHRYKSLKEIFTIPSVKLTANPLIEEYIERKVKRKDRGLVIIGPDWESYQWAEEVAKRIGAEATVFSKKRYSSRHVEEKMNKKVEMKGKDAVIVDDIISTGHTIAEAAKKAKKMGAKKVVAIGVHGLLVENAIGKMRKAGVDKIVTSNCIEHQTNEIDVTSLIIDEVKKERQ
jgi:ribose-phosphate pyrophosphokinase